MVFTHRHDLKHHLGISVSISKSPSYCRTFKISCARNTFSILQHLLRRSTSAASNQLNSKEEFSMSKLLISYRCLACIHRHWGVLMLCISMRYALHKKFLLNSFIHLSPNSLVLYLNTSFSNNVIVENKSKSVSHMFCQYW